jgi:hypothetical protein
MCDPVSIGIAIMAAGGLAENLGNQKAARAQERATNQERARKMKLTAEQQGYLDDTLKRVTEASGDDAQRRAADARNSTLAAAVVPQSSETAYSPGVASAPAVVGQVASAAAGKSRDESLGLARALAELGGTNDNFQQLGIDAGRNRQNIAQAGGFMRGSADVLDSELLAAAQQGATLRGLGQMGQQIGSAAVTGGMMGGGGGGGGLSSMFQSAQKTPLVNLGKMAKGNIAAFKSSYVPTVFG